MFLETKMMEEAVVEWLSSLGVHADIVQDLAVLLVAYVLALPIAALTSIACCKITSSDLLPPLASRST